MIYAETFFLISRCFMVSHTNKHTISTALMRFITFSKLLTLCRFIINISLFGVCYAFRSCSHHGRKCRTFPLPMMYMYGDSSTSSPSVKITSPRWKTTVSREDIIFSKLWIREQNRTIAHHSRTSIYTVVGSVSRRNFVLSKLWDTRST